MIEFLKSLGFFTKIPGYWTYKNIGAYVGSDYCILSDDKGKFHNGNFEEAMQKLKDRLGVK